MAKIAAAEWHTHQHFPPYCFFNIRQGREEMGASKSLYNTKESQAAVALLDYFATQFPNTKVNTNEYFTALVPHEIAHWFNKYIVDCNFPACIPRGCHYSL